MFTILSCYHAKVKRSKLQTFLHFFPDHFYHLNHQCRHKCQQQNISIHQHSHFRHIEQSQKDSDVDYIKGRGKLVVGVTDFEPMDYKDKDGNWIGFDADMAKLVGEKLGVEVDFVEIDWDNKVMELNSKNIDVVWNGMTLTSEVTSAMECTNAYCNNAQVVVVPEGK